MHSFHFTVWLGTELSCWFLAHDVRHAESAVAELPQMLVLSVLPVGSSQRNLAPVPGHFGFHQEPSDFAGVRLTELWKKLFFSIASNFVYLSCWFSLPAMCLLPRNNQIEDKCFYKNVMDICFEGQPSGLVKLSTPLTDCERPPEK